MRVPRKVVKESSGAVKQERKKERKRREGKGRRKVQTVPGITAIVGGEIREIPRDKTTHFTRRLYERRPLSSLFLSLYLSFSEDGLAS